MNRTTNIDYIIETESYIENHKDTIPGNVLKFLKQVCEDERKYHDLVKQWTNQKRVLKV